MSVALAGDMRAVHLSGANDNVLPTDTQKNTVYAFAKRLGGVEPELLALGLAAHFVDTGAVDLASTRRGRRVRLDAARPALVRAQRR